MCLMLFVVIAIGCSRPGNGKFSNYVALPDDGWAYGDSVTVVAQGLDSVESRQITIGLCHSDEYLYRNLWLEVSYRDRTGAFVRDSVNVPMADSHGRWLGQGLGATYQNETSVPRKANIGDSTRISVRHIMRVDTLRGLTKIGIAVENAEIK